MPRDAVDLAHVRAEALPQLLVAALADQVQVELADRRQEAVRVLDRDRARLAVVDLELVGERQLRLREAALEDAAGVDLLERDGLALRRDDGDGGGGGAPCADDHAVAVGVRAEEGVRLRVLAGVQAIGIGHQRVISDRAGT